MMPGLRGWACHDQGQQHSRQVWTQRNSTGSSWCPSDRGDVWPRCQRHSERDGSRQEHGPREQDYHHQRQRYNSLLSTFSLFHFFVTFFGLTGASISPTAMMQPFPLPSLLTALPSFFPSSPLRSQFHGGPGIEYARRRVLEHFGHKNKHLCEPDFSTVSCNFRIISSKCACGIVTRWSPVRDHLTEILLFCWVIAAC